MEKDNKNLEGRIYGVSNTKSYHGIYVWNTRCIQKKNSIGIKIKDINCEDIRNISDAIY